jgi:hypothetical protein
LKTILCPLLIFALIIFSISYKKDITILATKGAYAVFAWNDLGMHCLKPSYDEMVILPLFTTVNVQVVKGGDPLQNVTSGISVEYN